MRRRFTVLGVVQGVGFRPFVAKLASQLGLRGTVCNSGGVVRIEAYGDEEAIDHFICRLRAYPPPAARIERIVEEEPEEILPGKQGEISGKRSAGKGTAGKGAADKREPEDFTIVESEPDNGADVPLIPADLPVCRDCLSEMGEREDRRYRYPFISCVNCGPRYSILEALPYDRENITMRDYAMCPECAQQYQRPGDRRRHAQTISCHSCGPQLICSLWGENGEERTLEGEEALRESVRLLRKGEILALKGIGGYQLVCRIDREETHKKLRLLKGREKKPFAIMFPNLEKIQESCVLSDLEKELLLAPARPIVLLSPAKESGKKWPDELCKESRYIGAFLPYTGLHQILTQELGPLVVTSANRTEDPILTEEEGIEELRRNFPGLLRAVAWNTRRIVTSLDDSLMRVTGGRPQMLRRSRGFVPLPVRMKGVCPGGGAILAFGGDLKAAFALAVGERAYLSQYFGDMENYPAYRAYLKGMERMERLLSLKPRLLVCDLHPGYQTVQRAEERSRQEGIPLLKIQHHHAHAASVMAEHGLEHGIGVIFDGTGYGTDGHIWGGEFLLCRSASYIRMGHLSEIPLCGGDAAAKDAALTAACHLAAARSLLTRQEPSFLWERFREKTDFVKSALSLRLNTEDSSSMGRLFDAVSALLGFRERNSYEGECAIALENAAWRARERRRAGKENGQGGISFSAACNFQEELSFPILEKDGLLLADRNVLIARLLSRLAAEEERPLDGELSDEAHGIPKERAEDAALDFHEAIARMVVQICRKIREKEGENNVLLGGGVFANVLLQEQCRRLLEEEGFAVYVNEQTPGNDGGICLGQAWLAGRADKEDAECVLRCPAG